MTTVLDVTVQALRNLDALVEGEATGGNTTTVVDAALATGQLAYPDDHFNEGRVFILKTTDGLAPQGESRRVSDFNGSNGTITVPTAFSAAVGAGDRYGVGTKRYPAGQLVGKVNEALQEMGDVPTEDVSLTTLTGTQDYALPVAGKRELRQVWLARETTAPYNYEPLVHWRVSYTGPNTAATLVLPYQPRVGYKLRLVYLAAHPAVYADSDAISDYLGLAWPAAETALRLARGRLNQSGDDPKRTVQQINDLMQRAAMLRAKAIRDWPELHPTYPYSP